MVGCKTLENVHTEYITRTDTLYISKNVTDSIYITDSVFVREKGDTIYKEKWHTKYVEKNRVDTVYRDREKTTDIADTQTVIKKEIPKWVWWVLAITGSITLFVLIKFGLKLYTNIQTGGLTNIFSKIWKL